MTNSQPHTTKPPPKQLKYLTDLAIATGESFTYPQSIGAANREIKRLRRKRRTSRAERRRESVAVQQAMNEASGDAAAVRDSEIGGYGASATWRRAG